MLSVLPDLRGKRNVNLFSPLIPKIFAKWKENYATETYIPARLGMIKSALVFNPVVITAFPSLVR